MALRRLAPSSSTPLAQEVIEHFPSLSSATLILSLLLSCPRQHESPCGNASLPMPRTRECSKSYDRTVKERLERWHAFHKTLAAEASAYRNPHGQPSLLLLGDSITESYRGTAEGREMPRTIGIDGSLNASIKRFPVAGRPRDWRRRDALATGACRMGALAEPLRRSIALHQLAWAPITSAMLITRPRTPRGVMAVVRHILSASSGRLLVHALLPRGQSPRDKARRRPFVSLMPKVNRVNALIDAELDEVSRAYPGRVRKISCAAIFAPSKLMTQDGSEVNIALMPDALHPSVEGSRLLGECIREEVARWREEVMVGRGG